MSSPQEVWSYRNLIVNLVKRDLAAKYKRSALGRLWSLLNPASTLLIYSFVFGIVLRGSAPLAGNGTLQSFPLYLFAGLVVWNLFSNTVTDSMESLEESGELLTKIYFPPECPPLAASFAVLIQSLFEFGVLLVALILMGNLSWTALLIPVVIVLTILFGLGIGMILSVMNVRYRDVAYLAKILMQLMFYSTPIVYSLDLVPETLRGIPIREILTYNPIFHYVDINRELLWALNVPSAGTVLYGAAFSLGSFLFGWWFFNRKAPLVIEEL